MSDVLANRRTAVEAAIAATGLAPRGSFAAEPADALPAFADGRPISTVVLIGWFGRTGWAPFAAAPEASDGRPDPLDRWSTRVIGGLAEALGARPLFPFAGPPWWPFLAWGRRAEPLAASPLGLAIHPEVGLWHAWRGALGFADAFAAPPPAPVPSPCDGCAGRPCLSACPVGAFAETGYDDAACRAHLEGPIGGLCRTDGCRARDACPVGRRHRHAPDQIRFLMRAFRAVHPVPRSAPR